MGRRTARGPGPRRRGADTLDSPLLLYARASCAAVPVGWAVRRACAAMADRVFDSAECGRKRTANWVIEPPRWDSLQQQLPLCMLWPHACRLTASRMAAAAVLGFLGGQ